MNDSFAQLKYQTTDNPLPKNLGRRTKNKIIVFKFRYPIYFLALGLLLNLFFLTLRVYQNLLHSEALPIIQILIQDFELSFDYLPTSLMSLKEILPLKESIFLALDVVLLFSFGEFFHHYQEPLKLRINRS